GRTAQPARAHRKVSAIIPERAAVGSTDATASLLARVGVVGPTRARSAQQLPNGIPSHDTFSRLFAALDPKQLAACAGRWMAAVKAGIEANRCLVRFLTWIRENLLLRPDANHTRLHPI